MGLTVFSIPKAFEGHIGVIQRNAIRSWARLPDVQLVLLGGERGTAEMADEVGAVHVAEVERNSFGTPCLSSCFATASTVSEHELLACVNADIILMSDFTEAVARVARVRRPLLMGGQRTGLDIREPIAFREGWAVELRARAEREGTLLGPDGIDYFVFRRGLWPEIPPFAIGRWFWDNWLLYEAVRVGAALIDATPSVLAIHQNHGYDHAGAEGPTRRDGPEALANLALAPDRRTWFNLNHASRVLYPAGLVPAWTRERLRQRLLTWLQFHPRVLAPMRRLKRLWWKDVARPREP